MSDTITEEMDNAAKDDLLNALLAEIERTKQIIEKERQ